MMRSLSFNTSSFKTRYFYVAQNDVHFEACAYHSTVGTGIGKEDHYSIWLSVKQVIPISVSPYSLNARFETSKVTPVILVDSLDFYSKTMNTQKDFDVYCVILFFNILTIEYRTFRPSVFSQSTFGLQ